MYLRFHAKFAQKTQAKSSDVFKGFSTAGGRAVQVSDEAIMKVKNMFSEEASQSFDKLPNKLSDECTDMFKGVATAGGKKLQVSEALRKVEHLLTDTDKPVTGCDIPMDTYIEKEVPKNRNLNSPVYASYDKELRYPEPTAGDSSV